MLLTLSHRPIIDDGEGDIALWNRELAKVSSADGNAVELLLKHSCGCSSSESRLSSTVHGSLPKLSE